MKKFATARKVMAKELLDKTGKGDDCGYRANIAMLIYDDQRNDDFNTHREPPTNLGTVEGCQSMANRIIQLIFS